MKKWLATIKFTDGTILEKEFPYRANGNCSREEEEIYDIECQILTNDLNPDNVESYSVSYCDDEE